MYTDDPYYYRLGMGEEHPAERKLREETEVGEDPTAPHDHTQLRRFNVAAEKLVALGLDPDAAQEIIIQAREELEVTSLAAYAKSAYNEAGEEVAVVYAYADGTLEIGVAFS